MGWHEREALDSGCDAYISKTDLDPRLLGYGRIAPASFTTVGRNGSPKARWRGSGC